ncbi:hypothetical protein [Microbacterium sp. SSM24]|uniref:hypothetical protein n=1 Tax=Microbacterium sp. SSM24 TaxID=2991714 RepID=UPI00222739D1|nr:hypothetical protein [Microbacterium sp. SSM24]MCW3494221.1 hypothetical protein [Microbacterium sp. SSM24]
MSTVYSAHMRRMSGASAERSHGCDCTCPVCQGLHTFVRPRFFAGQLLTETELTGLTTYFMEKQRLHNRYLHGYGVVVGLQVECDGCGPGVIVRPGYAIDPCGADIVLPDTVSVDVGKLIASCSRRVEVDDCDPPRYPRADGCDDREQTWCLWVRYKEQQARPLTPLGGGAAPSGCGCGASRSPGGCGCGKSGGGTASSSTGSGTAFGAGRSTAATSKGGCGCGGGAGGTSSRATTCGCQQAPSRGSRDAACEPSRVYEYLEFGVSPKDEDCGTLESAIGGTFPAKVLECIRHLQPVLTKGLSKPMQSSALSVAMGGQVGLSQGVARDAVCQLYANVLELYQNDPMRTQCVLPEELSSIDCSPQGPNETDSQFLARLSLALQQLIVLVVLYLRDCVCYSALPPVPGAACDDRIVLACLTVKDGVVTKICNLACRRYAGSFVNREYWLPIGPVLSILAAKLCCFPLGLGRQVRVPDERRPDNLRRGFPFGAKTSSSGWRYDNILSAIRSDDFSLPKLWRDRARTMATKVRVGTVLAGVERSLERTKGSIRLASYLHADVATAAAALEKKGVQVEVVEVAERGEGLAFDAVPRVRKGGAATLYSYGGRVVGVRGSEGVDLGRRAER